MTRIQQLIEASDMAEYLKAQVREEEQRLILIANDLAFYRPITHKHQDAMQSLEEYKNG